MCPGCLVPMHWWCWSNYWSNAVLWYINIHPFGDITLWTYNDTSYKIYDAHPNIYSLLHCYSRNFCLIYLQVVRRCILGCADLPGWEVLLHHQVADLLDLMDPIRWEDPLPVGTKDHLPLVREVPEHQDPLPHPQWTKECVCEVCVLWVIMESGCLLVWILIVE